MLTCEDDVRKLLTEFADAWTRRDIPAILALMGLNAVYGASVRPEPGRSIRGHEEIAAGIAEMFAHDAGASIESHRLVVLGDHAVGRWTYTFDDGRKEEGIDLWHISNGKIQLKDAYHKTRA